MKKSVTRLLCGILLSSVIFCGCSQVTDTTVTESQTEATTVAEMGPSATTEARPEINVDNMMKIADLYASKQPEGKSSVPVFADGIRGSARYYVFDGVLHFEYSALGGKSSIDTYFQSGSRTANIVYDFTYNDKRIYATGTTEIDAFEKFIDDIVAGKTSDINMYDNSGLAEYSENLKKDLPIVYSRFITLADHAFPEIGLKLEDTGIVLGSKYRSVDPTQPTSMEPVASNDHKFQNGFCTDCKKSWTAYYYDAVGKMSGMTGKGWRSVYGQNSDAMLDPHDYIQCSSSSTKDATVLYFSPTIGDSDETESFSVNVTDASTKKKQKMSVAINYNFAMKNIKLGRGIISSKYSYQVRIKADPGQYDKVFESKESLMKYVTVDLYVSDAKGNLVNAWGKKANIEKLKKQFADDGCTYYTKEQVVERLWDHHEIFLTSIDSGMVWMAVSLADIGVNWKKTA